MEFIAHRINSMQDLKSVPVEYGVELDLRDDLTGRIYIQHNPFESGEDFEEYLGQYNHGTMILNIKSERIELKILELLRKYNIEKYFFLDSSFPMIKLLSDQGENKIALRFSEFEGLDTLFAMQGKIQWVWVDCFSRLPLDRDIYKKIKELGYKICIVSPELQGQPEKLVEYKEQLRKENIQPDAICTKLYNISKWQN